MKIFGKNTLPSEIMFHESRRENTSTPTPQQFPPGQHSRRMKRWVTSGARVHATKCFVCGDCVRSELACGFPQAVSLHGGLRIHRGRSTDVIVRVALHVYAGGPCVLWDRSLYKGVSVCFSATNCSTPALHYECWDHYTFHFLFFPNRRFEPILLACLSCLSPLSAKLVLLRWRCLADSGTAASILKSCRFSSQIFASPFWVALALGLSRTRCGAWHSAIRRPCPHTHLDSIATAATSAGTTSSRNVASSNPLASALPPVFAGLDLRGGSWDCGGLGLQKPLRSPLDVGAHEAMPPPPVFPPVLLAFSYLHRALRLPSQRKPRRARVFECSACSRSLCTPRQAQLFAWTRQLVTSLIIGPFTS